ncbi:MAG TPA: biotin/lipoate A/B protein ligase family protein [candidate division Zixibacteria bacterium]|nr:biotin/lipoate A/B protein ligase family protein [candidate division Zixibacteria bacterium]
MTEKNWRLIWQEQPEDCYYNMGLDKAIMEAVARREVPNTVKLYRWNPSAVSIGYFQSMRKVINIENCQKLGIDYIRRITGGGAVFHDLEGELTYSVNCLDSDKTIPQDITKIYEKICGGIVRGLKLLNVETEFQPINDIVLKSSRKKISGSALTRRNGVVLQHGTILRKVNVEKMFSLLIVPDEKIKNKLISSAKERVSSLELELGDIPSFKEIGNAVITGLEQKLDIQLVEDKITNRENEEAKRIAYQQFNDKDWLFKR